jgi:hypothetical protein
MKANEFIKKFGWNAARTCILNCACPDDRLLMRHGDLISDQDFDDLKRLVESYELVERFGGLEKAKEMKIGEFPLGWVMNTSRLEQAIADVESCQ